MWRGRAEELGDEFETVSKILSMQFQSALIATAPALVELIRLLGTGVQAATSFGKALNDAFIKGSANLRLADVTEQIGGLEKQLSTTGGLNFGAGLFAVDDAAVAEKQKALASLREEQKKLNAEINNFSTVVSGQASTAVKKATEETKGYTVEQLKAQAAIERQIKSTKAQADTLLLSGVALADQVAKQAILDGATTEQAARLRQEVIALENAKAAREANTKAIQAQAEAEREAIRKQAEAKREAEALAKAIDADRIKREEFLADLLEKRAIQEQQDAEANIASLAALQGELATLQEEGRLINASLGPKQELVDLEREIALARIEREAATARTTAAENGLTEAETANIEAARLQKIANVEATASFAAMAQAVEDAALSTADLKTITQGILSGTQDIGDVFGDLGETLGVRLVDGILFGKGEGEQAILGNFNQLLGVDAARTVSVPKEQTSVAD